MIDEIRWSDMERQTKAILERIENNDETLTPDDLKEVKSFRKEMEDYFKEFKKALTQKQKDYIAQAESRLVSIGYDRIEQFCKMKNDEQKLAVENRMNAKIAKLESIVNEALEKTIHLKNHPLGKEMFPNFVTRFPKIKSGALDKKIKDWKPYETAIQTTIQTIDLAFANTSYPYLKSMPLHSNSMRLLMLYIKDGDPVHMEQLTSAYMQDNDIIVNMMLKQNLHTKKDCVLMLHKKLSDDLQKPQIDYNKVLKECNMIMTIAATLLK